MKKTINIGAVDPLLFFGINDNYIKLSEHNFTVKIVVRGNQIKLDGKKNEITILNQIFNDMLYAIEKNASLDEQSMRILIDLASTESNGQSNSVLAHDTILYTHKGSISARTKGQREYLKAVNENDITFAVGPAGTGKTYQAVACAVAALKEKKVNKIVITRPAVEAGESLGFLPGDLKEKVDPYLTPLYDALNDMMEKEKLKLFVQSRIIEIAPLAYMRGRTLHNAFIILDEAQNATTMQMKMFLTRLGVTSKCIITGDITQIDLPNNHISGLIEATRILKNVDGIACVEFDENDVVRHKLVKDIIRAYTKREENE